MAVPRALLGFTAGVVALAALPASPALEPEDVLVYQAGPLVVKPQVGLAEQYNDNLFYQDRNEIRDFITFISPGLKLQLGKPDHNYIGISYTLDELLYADNSELNSAQHSLEIVDRFELQRLRLEGTDRIQFLSSPLGGVERAVGITGGAIAVRGNIERNVFDDVYTLTYDISDKMAAYLRGRHSSSDYQEGVTLYDIQALTGTAGFGYRAFAKTVFFGEVYYGQTTTEPNYFLQPSNPRLDSIGGYVGARGNFTPKLTGAAKIGYETREFAGQGSGTGDPVVDIYLNQQFTEKQSLTLNYSRSSAVSIQYSQRTYTADFVGLTFTQAFGSSRKWQAGIGASYSHYAYDSTPTAPAIQSDYLRGSLTLGYRIQRWLSANLAYEYERAAGDSSAVIDYVANRVTLRLAVGY